MIMMVKFATRKSITFAHIAHNEAEHQVRHSPSEILENLIYPLTSEDVTSEFELPTKAG